MTGQLDPVPIGPSRESQAVPTGRCSMTRGGAVAQLNGGTFKSDKRNRWFDMTKLCDHG